MLSAALGSAAAVLWLIAALLWLWEWWRARALLQPLVEELRQAIRDCEAARLGLSAVRSSTIGTLCPRCAKTSYIEIEALGSLRYCAYCGAPLVAR